MTAPLRLYLAASALVAPLLVRAAARAHKKMGANAVRFDERLVQNAPARPKGPLIWFNAASAGEATSVIELARDLAKMTDATLLFTTATQSAATLVQQRLPKAIHQFQPLDTPKPAKAFFDHWQPDLICYVENDMLPRLMRIGFARGVPSAILNARPSSTRRKLPRSMGELYKLASLITVQDSATADEFEACGIARSAIFQQLNLKSLAPPPPADPLALDALKQAIGSRPHWAAVSTHEGEEHLMIAAHQHLCSIQPDAMMTLVPRHTERADQVAKLLKENGVRFARRSTDALPKPNDQVYLMDTFGETGLVFRLAPLVVLGGSFTDKGGHNPYEPAKLGAAILHGPHVGNFIAAYNDLAAAGASSAVTQQTLGQSITDLMQTSERLEKMQSAVRNFGHSSTEDRTQLLEALAAFLATQ